MNEPFSVGDILSKMTQESGLGKHLEAARIWEAWPEIAGEPLYMHGRPSALKDGRLTIECESAVWMHRYAYARYDILNAIERHAGRQLVTELFIVHADSEPGESEGFDIPE